MSVKVSLSSKAYYKIMLHCIKHISNDCYGVLVGAFNEGEYKVDDAVPLSHDKIYTPLFDVAMASIEKNCEGKVIGFYENSMLNQMKSDPIISKQGKFLCEILKAKSNIRGALIEISSKDNSKNGIIDDIIFVRQFVYNDKGFDVAGEFNESEEQFQQLKKYLQDNRQNEIVDFDDHLLNANLDWRNLFVN